MDAKGLARRVAAQPVVRFVALGALVFGAYRWWGEGGAATVELAQAPRGALAASFSDEHGREPTKSELGALVREWAEEEALLRHAYDLGLHRADTVVRRRLIQDVEFLLEAEAEPVTEGALRAYYARERKRFMLPEQRSFEHVFVSGSDEASRTRAHALRTRLLAGEAPDGLGDPSSAGPQLAAVTRERLATRLGAGVARRAFELVEGTWSAPLASELGFHLLRLTDRIAQRPQAYEEVETTLREELTRRARQRALSRGRRQLRERYVRGERP